MPLPSQISVYLLNLFVYFALFASIEDSIVVESQTEIPLGNFIIHVLSGE